MSDDVRQKLIDAGRREYGRRQAEDNADAALAVFAEWLRKQAAVRDASVTYWSHHQDTDGGRATLERAKVIRATLRELADSISPEGGKS